MKSFCWNMSSDIETTLFIFSDTTVHILKSQCPIQNRMNHQDSFEVQDRVNKQDSFVTFVEDYQGPPLYQDVIQNPQIYV